VVLRTSAGDAVLADIPAGPALVVATPGAEPVAPDGYGAALLLDGWALLNRPDLRAAEETMRRWANAAALVRGDGTVIVGADASLAVVQALLRWDPAGHAERELADRRELNFPPVSRMAALVGAPADVAELLSLCQLPASTEELGSVPVQASRSGQPTEHIRSLLRVPRPDGVLLAEALHAAAAVRSAKKSGAAVRIMLDPLELF
jgi:primosomal protein N' (replication factor Y)